MKSAERAAAVVAALMMAAGAAAAVRCFDAPRPSSADADMTRPLQRVIDRAAAWQRAHPSDSVTVRLSQGATYSITRVAASPLGYYVSNTTSEDENPGNPTKHVGLLLKGLRNFTLDGGGSARILTHGEMTPWVADSCSNLTLRGFSIDAADPTVAEMTVTAVEGNTLTAHVNPLSRYRIGADGTSLAWTGEGWEFSGGIAQLFDPVDSVTLRCPSPMAGVTSVGEPEPGTLRLTYTSLPQGARPGITYQMRHSLRTEVAGLINCCRDVTLEDIDFHFMGNFGVVAQNTDNLTYRRLRCAPDTERTGRTCAGFADFLQVSGCGGRVEIADCSFAGSHDDPINIHGTHLQVVGVADDAMTLTLRYAHPQTYGFQSFFPSDSIELIDSRTLLPVGAPLRVVAAALADPRHIVVRLAAPAPEAIAGAAPGDFVAENITRTPEVSITGCRFTLTPTRAILVTTRGRVTIAGNSFVRIPMASVLVADDARSWYESGRTTDVAVSTNSFIDCSAPQVLVWPENSVSTDERVHGRIAVEANSFVFSADRTPFGRAAALLRVKSADNVRVSGNTLAGPDPGLISRSVELTDCTRSDIENF